MRNGGLRRAAMASLTGMAAAVAVLAAPGPARAAASADEARLFAMSNGVRASAGAPALVLDESLSAVARRWAATMAASGALKHNPNLANDVTGWTKVAENVGMGPDLDTIERALVASPRHYANLVDREVTRMGVAVVTAGGTVFVVENFMRPSGSGPTTPPTTPPTTRVVAPPTTVARPPVTTTTAPVTTVPVATAPAGPSQWLVLALEVTRSWERATG